jgi:hypothetical protein
MGLTINKFFKQYNIRWIGLFINVLYLTTPIFGIGAYAMSAATMYATVVIPYIKPMFPWFDFWVFAIFAGVICCFMLLMVWKFVYRGYFGNPIKQDVEKIKKHLGIKD